MICAASDKGTPKVRSDSYAGFSTAIRSFDLWQNLKSSAQSKVLTLLKPSYKIHS